MSASRSRDVIDKAGLEAFFGREFEDEELAHFGSRLQRQMHGLQRLRAWESKLGLIEPATVTRLNAESSEHDS